MEAAISHSTVSFPTVWVRWDARLLTEGPAFGGAWNFGPLEQTGVTTAQVVEELVNERGSRDWEHLDAGFAKVEAGTLRLPWAERP
jgi:hypothetical protein